MDRSNPYEAAFEAYLQEQGLCYVAVDETRRAMLGETPVKNLDFIVLGPCRSRLLIDVKGRRFPGGPPDKPRYVWENWATQDDVAGLRSWSRLFGPHATPLFVFLYRLLPTVSVPADSPGLWRWRGDDYLIRAVALDDYVQHLRVRSPKWGTVGVPSEAFRTLARPFRHFTHELTVPEAPTDAPLEDQPGPEDLEHAVAAALAGAAEAGRGRA